MHGIHRRCLFLAVASFTVAFGGGPLLVAGENYALLVAVGNYDLKELRPLKFTRADVLEFQGALLESGFAPKNIVLMHDDLKQLVAHYDKLGRDYDPKSFIPVGANIRKRLELLLGRLRTDDSVVVALSGHGVNFRNEQKSYFCPADAKLEEKGTLIGFDEVFEALKASRAGRKLFLVDACQNDPLSEIAKSRRIVDIDSVTRPQTEAVPEGIIALYSCRAGQKSYEFPDLGHGVFFYHLLEGWKGAADRNGDGKLTYRELAEHTEIRTAEFAALKLEALQTPQLEAKFSGEWVLRTYGDEKVITNSLGSKLVRIPAGEYLRGSSASEIDRILETDSTAKADFLADEQPQHRVRITRPFYVGRTEVTQAEWQSVMGTNPSRFSKSGDYASHVRGLNTARFPVENISWYDAAEFCNQLSVKENLSAFYRLANVARQGSSIAKADVTILGGKGYRLPTEAEWEYACRAGTTTLFHFGEASNGTEANIDGSYPLGTSKKGTYLNRTTTVGSYAENSFGLVDMHGNVWEWCQDWYSAAEYEPFASKTAVNPQGPIVDQEYRVLRGGSWWGYAWYTRSARRLGSSNRDGAAGFRLARTP